jgi:hypothetical protein
MRTVSAARTLPSEAEVLDWVHRCLGPVRASEPLHSQESRHRVFRVEVGSDDVVVVKSCADAQSYFRTIDALTRHTEALANAAPRLIDQSDSLRSLVMTCLPGQPADSVQAREPRWHQRVGALLRQFHESAPSTLSADLGKEWVARITALLDHAGADLNPLVVREGRELALGLLDLGPIKLVPIHGSNYPGHWLVDEARGLHLIGFSRTEYDPWIVDTAVLERELWVYSPGARKAFYAGYDREPEESDLLILRARNLIDALEHWSAAQHPRRPRTEKAAARRMLESAIGGTLF